MTTDAPTERLTRQIAFILEIDRLKGVLRRSYLADGTRRENSAEHSWHLALMAMVLAEHANVPVDALRVLQMLLVHDIVEIDADDTYCYDEVGALDKEEREQRAADRIFGLLPPDQERDMRGLWDEFEARVTPEARFAAALDRLMPLLHNYHTQGRSWRENGITSRQVRARNAHIADGSEELWRFAGGLIEDAVSRGFLPPG
ncbi:MAG: HD domain-containing protein [Armatimonadetes bacterium]|nr:HD domain-containing protein [Armatimonadota bacterium]